MSKRLVFTVALAAAIVVGALALTMPAATAGGPCLIQQCSQCPDVIVHPDGRICENPVCIVGGGGCLACKYECHY